MSSQESTEATHAALNARQRCLRCVAMASLVVYIAWQAAWLSAGRIPPALFLALTGWPAPTTGGTRSFAALMRGDWQRSLYHNPMTIPILAALLVTLVTVLPQLVRRQRLSLPPRLALAWMVILSTAWIVKLMLHFWQPNLLPAAS